MGKKMETAQLGLSHQDRYVRLDRLRWKRRVAVVMVSHRIRANLVSKEKERESEGKREREREMQTDREREREIEREREPQGKWALYSRFGLPVV